MYPILIKFACTIIAGAILFSPPAQPTEPPTYDNLKLENAQNIADLSDRSVKAWMDNRGRIMILFAEEKPIAPYTLLHSTWMPR